MEISNLYIVGNGFDIYHGIPSRYSDFKEYLRDCDQSLHDRVSEYLPVEEHWCNLELAFSYLDVDQVIDEATQYLQSYSAENWSDSFHHNYQYELDKIVSDLSSALKSNFVKWINQLELPLPESLTCKLVGLRSNSIFFSFNYTRTLQYVYGVSDENIVHIHGEAEQGESEIVLGHSWNPAETPDLNDVPYPEDMDTRVMEGNELINSYFSATFKPSEKIIEDNIDFFSSLEGIQRVYVLGHSLSEVDLPYFEKIANNINPHSEWIVTYYGGEELARHKHTINKLGVENVIYFNLSDVE